MEKVGYCEWKKGRDVICGTKYTTSCKKEFIVRNEMVHRLFCCYCGKRIKK